MYGMGSPHLRYFTVTQDYTATEYLTSITFWPILDDGND